mmetsp:Transcript_34000/g.108035  ORF Transcript_34000/g.108035 Transcript_34000/m.108035 type:complete len:202 (+) Transcript_34000:134-739(+)
MPPPLLLVLLHKGMPRVHHRCCPARRSSRPGFCQRGAPPGHGPCPPGRDLRAAGRIGRPGPAQAGPGDVHRVGGEPEKGHRAGGEQRPVPMGALAHPRRAQGSLGPLCIARGPQGGAPAAGGAVWAGRRALPAPGVCGAATGERVWAAAGDRLRGAAAGAGGDPRRAGHAQLRARGSAGVDRARRACDRHGHLAAHGAVPR